MTSDAGQRGLDAIGAYDAAAPLSRAATIPSAWYLDPAIARHEERTVFSHHWVFAARRDQLGGVGAYVTAEIGGEPIVVVRDRDGGLRAFYNVCRHHAALVATGACGRAPVLRCPYHGWTYGLDGALKGVPEFDGVEDFERSQHGLRPVAVDVWEQFVFVRLSPSGPTLAEHVGRMAERVAPLGLSGLRFVDRRVYEVHCNWKVFVDNYLDGGYHVPHIHPGLGSVLDYAQYTIEIEDRYCLQSSPITSGGDATTSQVRRGARANYFWLYPNFMLNWYEGVMDVNVVQPLSIDRTRVIFDFYFAETGEEAAARQRLSITVAERVQHEDIDICESVQRGLRSRSYDVGRLSVRREAGEHLFHRLLSADLRATPPD